MPNPPRSELLRSEAAYAPVDPKDFIFAVELFQAAASGQAPQPKAPSDVRLEVDFGGGDIKGISFTDTPMNRGMLAINREFQHLKQVQRMALLMRIIDFVPFCKDNRARLRRLGLLREAGQEWELSEAVHHAAAICPYESYQKKGETFVRFKAERFFAIAVEEHAKPDPEEAT